MSPPEADAQCLDVRLSLFFFYNIALFSVTHRHSSFFSENHR